MGLFGLPGEAVTVLLTAWLSSSAGTGIAVSLLSNGTINGTHATILIPAIFLLGSQIQYMGRLLGVADVPKKYWPLLMLTSILNASIANGHHEYFSLIISTFKLDARTICPCVFLFQQEKYRTMSKPIIIICYDRKGRRNG